MGETAIDHIAGEDFCTFYANERWSRNLAIQMYKEHPDEVKDFREYEDGGISCKIPFKCMQYIRWPTKREMSEEQKEALRQRMSKTREKMNED